MLCAELWSKTYYREQFLKKKTNSWKVTSLESPLTLKIKEESCRAIIAQRVWNALQRMLLFQRRPRALAGVCEAVTQFYLASNKHGRQTHAAPHTHWNCGLIED